jgi:hypothetical protein
MGRCGRGWGRLRSPHKIGMLREISRERAPRQPGRARRNSSPELERPRHLRRQLSPLILGSRRAATSFVTPGRGEEERKRAREAGAGSKRTSLLRDVRSASRSRLIGTTRLSLSLSLSPSPRGRRCSGRGCRSISRSAPPHIVPSPFTSQEPRGHLRPFPLSPGLGQHFLPSPSNLQSRLRR